MKVLFKGRVWDTVKKTENLTVILKAVDDGEIIEMTAKRFLSDEVSVIFDSEEEA